MGATVTDGTTTVTPRLVLGYESKRPSQNVFHPVIGRSDDDVTKRPAGLRKGTLSFLFDSESDAVACENMHTDGVFTVADVDVSSVGMTYMVDGDIGRKQDEDITRYWIVSVDFREVRQ